MLNSKTLRHSEIPITADDKTPMIIMLIWRTRWACMYFMSAWFPKVRNPKLNTK